jgi:hypothetical protein
MPPPQLLGNNPPLLPADEVQALRAATWMGVSGTVDSQQIQALSAQVYLLNEWMRYLSDFNWAAIRAGGPIPLVANPIGGGGGAAPPPPPSWPP